MSGGDYEESYQLAVENLAMIRQLGSPNLLVRLLHSLGWITNSLGRYQEAEAYWRESLTLHKEIDSQVDIGLTFSHLGWSAWCAGGDRLQAALDYGQQALAIFEAVGHQSHLAMAFADLALYHLDAKNPNQTYQYAQQGLVIARQINNKDYLAYNLYTLGMAEIEAGRTAMGWAHLLEGLQTAWEADILAHVLTISYWFAKLLSDESQKPDLGKTLSQEKQRQALEILVVGLQSPFWWAIIRTRAIDLKARLTAALPPEIVLEIESLVQGRRLADLVRDLLQSSASTP
jgi:tetratricopeptide (TPR) repeat protein